MGKTEKKAVTGAPADGVVTLADLGVLSLSDNCVVYVEKDGVLTVGSLNDLVAGTNVECVTVDGIVTMVFADK